MAVFEAEGLDTQTWSNEGGFAYALHSHPRHKVLFCLDGQITFHTPGGDIALGPGDRLDLPPGTLHAASVGPHGVTCIEAFRPA
jgi:quercetin dioxygenase-like cupin family protein